MDSVDHPRATWEDVERISFPDRKRTPSPSIFRSTLRERSTDDEFLPITVSGLLAGEFVSSLPI